MKITKSILVGILSFLICGFINANAGTITMGGVSIYPIDINEPQSLAVSYDETTNTLTIKDLNNVQVYPSSMNNSFIVINDMPDNLKILVKGTNYISLISEITSAPNAGIYIYSKNVTFDFEEGASLNFINKVVNYAIKPGIFYTIPSTSPNSLLTINGGNMTFSGFGYSIISTGAVTLKNTTMDASNNHSGLRVDNKLTINGGMYNLSLNSGITQSLDMSGIDSNECNINSADIEINDFNTGFLFGNGSTTTNSSISSSIINIGNSDNINIVKNIESKKSNITINNSDFKSYASESAIDLTDSDLIINGGETYIYSLENGIKGNNSNITIKESGNTEIKAFDSGITTTGNFSMLDGILEVAYGNTNNENSYGIYLNGGIMDFENGVSHIKCDNSSCHENNIALSPTNSPSPYNSNKIKVGNKMTISDGYKVTSTPTIFELKDSSTKVHDVTIYHMYDFNKSLIYNKSHPTELDFSIDNSDQLFQELYINNGIVNETNFTHSSSGSNTLFTIKKSAIENLPVGEYEVKVAFSNGIASTILAVIIDENNNPTDNTVVNNTTKNPVVNNTINNTTNNTIINNNTVVNNTTQNSIINNNTNNTSNNNDDNEKENPATGTFLSVVISLLLCSTGGIIYYLSKKSNTFIKL